MPAAPADTHHDAEDPGPTTAGQLAANRDPSPAPADFDQPSEANEPEVYYLGPANPDVDQDPEGELACSQCTLCHPVPLFQSDLITDHLSGGWPLPYIPPTDAEHIMKTVRTMLALMEHITDPALRPKDIDELKLTFKDNASQLWLAQLDYDVMTVRAEREKQREKLDALDRWVEGVLNV